MNEISQKRVESEMKLALVELLRLFESGLIPRDADDVEVILQCLVRQARTRLGVEDEGSSIREPTQLSIFDSVRVSGRGERL